MVPVFFKRYSNLNNRERTVGRIHNSERRQNFPGIRGTATLGKLLHEFLNFSLDGGLAVGLCDVDVDFCDIRVVHQRRL